ncbi:hypothetical protein AAVH_06675 [Aphelenchoides avenae]|nr:hypothetical protein AAVH_06675 [Aphelenchus avenae]
MVYALIAILAFVGTAFSRPQDPLQAPSLNQVPKWDKFQNAPGTANLKEVARQGEHAADTVQGFGKDGSQLALMQAQEGVQDNLANQDGERLNNGAQRLQNGASQIQTNGELASNVAEGIAANPAQWAGVDPQAIVNSEGAPQSNPQ